tara:strand:+ start:19344 stop:22640 length:3297 start_codon:yes stop_codon:yes gene_type:complete
VKKYRFVIHVGYPKAASTSLQDALLDSSVLLEQNGFLYPSSLISKGSSKHEEIFRLVRLNKVDKALALLKIELDSAKDVHTVFLSTESIVNQLYNIDSSLWVRLFDGIKRFGSLEIVVIHREINGFLTSYYKQAVVNQPSSLVEFYGTSLTQADFSKLAVVRKLTNLDGVIETLKYVSNAPVKVFDYQQSVVNDVISWLTNGHFSVDTPKLSNVSLQPEEVELIRQINAATPSVSERNTWLHVLSHCCPLGSRTALTLADRANEADLQQLDAGWLLTVLPAQNPELGVNNNKLLSLSKKAYEWLSQYQRDCRLNQSLQYEDSSLMPLKTMDSVELERCVVKKIEQVVTASSNVSLGEKLFTAKKIELAPFAPVSFTGWGSWEQDPLNNRSWQWRLNWLSFLSYLLAYHQQSNNDEILTFGKEAITSWLSTYLETDTEYPFEFIWHDHATALRAEQLVLFSYYCRDNAPEWTTQNAAFLTYLEQALVVHAEWLAKDSFYSEHTNHGLEQARVLLLLGTVFEGKQAEEWQQIAIQRISCELQFAFTNEGVHVENSPAYHIFVFKVFLGIIKDYSNDVLGDLASQFSQFSAKALNFITHILRPDGLLPPIGDTEQLPTSDAYKEMFGSTNEYQHFLYALSQGKQGIKPKQLNVVYPKSGYAVFRDCWPERDQYKQAFHAIAKVGCSSRYHHQQDEGHVSVYAGGEDWLIDSGLYNYINKDPIRKYMRGRQGHNVPLISNASYGKDFEHRLAAWKVADYSEREVLPHIAMQLEVLQPVVQNRHVCFSSVDKVLVIEDLFVSEDNQPRNFTLQWHIPKNKTVTVNGNQVTVTSTSGQEMIIDVDGPEPNNISVAKGVKEDKVFSCISYKANHYEPSQVIKVTYEDYAELAVKTRFSFEHVLPSFGLDGKDNSVASSAQGLTSNNIINYLYDQLRREKPLVVVTCGAEDATIGIAKALRENGIGCLVILENSEERAENVKKSLKENYLQSWVEWRTGDLTPWEGDNVIASPPQQNTCWFPVELLEDLEAVDFVWIASSFEKGSDLSCYLALPALLERLSTQAQLWVNGMSAPTEEEFCKQWASRHGFEFEYVSRKNGLGVLSRS